MQLKPVTMYNLFVYGKFNLSFYLAVWLNFHTYIFVIENCFGHINENNYSVYLGKWCRQTQPSRHPSHYRVCRLLIWELYVIHCYSIYILQYIENHLMCRLPNNFQSRKRYSMGLAEDHIEFLNIFITVLIIGNQIYKVKIAGIVSYQDFTKRILMYRRIESPSYLYNKRLNQCPPLHKWLFCRLSH